MISSHDGTDARLDLPLAAFLADAALTSAVSAAAPALAAGVSAACSPAPSAWPAVATADVAGRGRPDSESAASAKSASLGRAGAAALLRSCSRACSA